MPNTSAQAGDYRVSSNDQPARLSPTEGAAGIRTVNRRIAMARATWDTGWFQAEIIRALLIELGYKVKTPQTMSNQAFYRSAAKGDVDLWANGWFPSHDIFVRDDQVRGKVEAVGFEVRAGALQGYMIDKQSADRLGIEKLNDLQDPTVAAVFDQNGNGKADLIGCNAGWGCERIVERHLDENNLRTTVEHIQGEYSPVMDETISRYRRGNPVLFYTWTPNWTVGTLVPGKDVVWLEVASANVRIRDVPGCVNNPCAMGFPPNDIRAVVNVEFLKTHPDVRRLLESVKIPLEDISRQNAKMLEGEDTYDNIKRHAKAWIRQNRITTRDWLKQAKALRHFTAAVEGPADEVTAAPSGERVLRVVTQRAEPFVIYQDNRYMGFSIDLWDAIAKDIGLKYEIYGVNTIAKLLDDVQRGAADVAVSGIGITSERERALDFSHSFFETGLQIMVPSGSVSVFDEIVHRAVRVLFSRKLHIGVAVFLMILLATAHIIWILERRHNPQFPRSYLQGLWQSIWWSVVTVTTVGYGDKVPKGALGRLFGLVWILAGYFVFAYFTASVSSTFTVRKLHGTINGPEDLFGKKVATVARSTAAIYLAKQGLPAVELEEVQKAYRLLETGKVDAVVYDAPVLQHYASKKAKGKVRVVGLVFKEKNYGIALPRKSDLRDRINISLLQLIESGGFDEIKKTWFGP